MNCQCLYQHALSRVPASFYLSYLVPVPMGLTLTKTFETLSRRLLWSMATVIAQTLCLIELKRIAYLVTVKVKI